MRIPLLAALVTAALLPATAAAQHRAPHGDRHAERGRPDFGHAAPDRPQPPRRDRSFATPDRPQQVQRDHSLATRDRGQPRQRPAPQRWTGNDRQRGDRDDAHYDVERRRDDHRGRGDYRAPDRSEPVRDAWRDDHGPRRLADDRRYRQAYARNHADWRDHDRYQRRFYGREGFNHDWRRDRRYDWAGYRVRNRAAFHLPRYYAPRGWDYGYRRFSIGYALDPVLLGSSYWIGDPYAYRLPAYGGGYRWVRYYDDALLVDLRSGTVVDIVYGIFW